MYWIHSGNVCPISLRAILAHWYVLYSQDSCDCWWSRYLVFCCTSFAQPCSSLDFAQPKRSLNLVGILFYDLKWWTKNASSLMLLTLYAKFKLHIWWRARVALIPAHWQVLNQRDDFYFKIIKLNPWNNICVGLNIRVGSLWFTVLWLTLSSSF